MGNSLDELASYFRPKAEQLIANCKQQGVPVRVIDTGRTVAEQTQKLKANVSWTKFSKHEPQRPEMKSEAIDVVPEVILAEGKSDWDPQSVLWLRIGVIGEALGLLWGGRWRSHADPSHFEWKEVRNDLGDFAT